MTRSSAMAWRFQAIALLGALAIQAAAGLNLLPPPPGGAVTPGSVSPPLSGSSPMLAPTGNMATPTSPNLGPDYGGALPPGYVLPPFAYSPAEAMAGCNYYYLEGHCVFCYVPETGTSPSAGGAASPSPTSDGAAECLLCEQHYKLVDGSCVASPGPSPGYGSYDDYTPATSPYGDYTPYGPDLGPSSEDSGCNPLYQSGCCNYCELESNGQPSCLLHAPHTVYVDGSCVEAPGPAPTYDYSDYTPAPAPYDYEDLAPFALSPGEDNAGCNGPYNHGCMYCELESSGPVCYACQEEYQLSSGTCVASPGPAPGYDYQDYFPGPAPAPGTEDIVFPPFAYGPAYDTTCDRLIEEGCTYCDRAGLAPAPSPTARKLLAAAPSSENDGIGPEQCYACADAYDLIDGRCVATQPTPAPAPELIAPAPEPIAPAPKPIAPAPKPVHQPAPEPVHSPEHEPAPAPAPTQTLPRPSPPPPANPPPPPPQSPPPPPPVPQQEGGIDPAKGAVASAFSVGLQVSSVTSLIMAGLAGFITGVTVGTSAGNNPTPQLPPPATPASAPGAGPAKAG